MSRTNAAAVVAAVMDRHGKTYAEEIGFDPGRNRPSELFQLLVASLLFSARISSQLAVEAARSVFGRGWTTAEKLAASTWDERVEALHEAGYTRYQEQTASMLADTADLVRDRYRGDLRKLRAEADRDPDDERKLLEECKGIGDVGVDIFFREAQGAWEELYPFADRRALSGAGALGLPEDAEKLAGLVSREEFPRLVAALVRVEQVDDADEVDRAAAEDAGGSSSDTKAELYERARKLDIAGRSRMSKQQLAAAVEAASG